MREPQSAPPLTRRTAWSRSAVVIGVTVLTSIDDQILNRELSVRFPMGNHVAHLAQLAQDSGLSGVVASPHEIAQIKAACGPKFLVVTRVCARVGRRPTTRSV